MKWSSQGLFSLATSKILSCYRAILGNNIAQLENINNQAGQRWVSACVEKQRGRKMEKRVFKATLYEC